MKLHFCIPKKIQIYAKDSPIIKQFLFFSTIICLVFLRCTGDGVRCDLYGNGPRPSSRIHRGMDHNKLVSFPSVVSFICFVSNVCLLLFSFWCSPSDVHLLNILLILFFSWSPSDFLLMMFSFYKSHSEVFLLNFSLPCSPSDVLLLMIFFWCFSSSDLLLTFSFWCSPYDNVSEVQNYPRLRGQ